MRPEFPPLPCPGIVVDEAVSKLDGHPFIGISVYDDEGNRVYYTDFPINASPEEIAAYIGAYAMGLLEDPPACMSPEDVVILSDLLKEQAKKVPGL